MVLAFMFGLILLTNYVVQTHASQVDNFPIGLNITYVVGVDIPLFHNEYQTTYDFIRWIDQENLTVEFENDYTIRVKQFPEIRLPGPAQPPLWMDVSSWSLGDTVEISGIGYPIILMEDYLIPGVGTCESFRLESVVQANGRENASSFWYHAQLGLLIDYLRVDMDISSNEMIVAYTDFIIVSNFPQFNPPTFTLPEPTQTTSTTTTTSTSTTVLPDQTTTPSPTSTTTSGIVPPVGLTEMLGVGIIVEILIIIIIVRRRGN
jgi:hypothetical protein